MTLTRYHKQMSIIPFAAFMIGLGGCAGMDAIAAGPMGDMVASAAGIPQTGAFLPDKSSVPPSTQMPIDGTYTISTLGKRVAIDRGRGYAVDGWTHALTLKIAPGMVTIRNITQIDDMTYSGDDLPLQGKTRLTVQPDGSIAAVVSGMIPYRYVLIPVTDYGAVPSRAPEATPSPISGDDDPGLDTCKRVAPDPETDELVCVER